ncbi:MAG: metal-sulfur cluster assembly factor [Sedimenticola sp.]|uniref:Metal-sulfur cluster assembly factor n=1 Tax=Sedimenticola thiotaurini TaxID=1543721 RepID=A0A558CSX4_9GAMM|nr:metal-sulfur cluster assembly factor [Sedimenticola sp.]MCW8976499.1 metal-sulfur cluster assembly factor [Sedimenticola sp.]MDF1527560.1 metal-sulfur cluster assembly factor [Sedimenticola sp.]TVT51869.1 MAG: metal-sulfur cluster assembly factor [Sedimenticola thiotaurini]
MNENLSKEEIAREVIYEALRGVIDPEVGINIVDLGLVYEVSANAERVDVHMTLTSPACPMGSQIAEESRAAIRAKVPASVIVDIKLVWEPMWSPEQMSDKAKQLLGWN